VAAVLRGAPIALTVGAFVVILLAPDVAGLWLVLTWTVIWATYRLVANGIPDRVGRAAVDVVFLVLAFAAAFEGGWFFIPAGIAYLVHDLVRPTMALPTGGGRDSAGDRRRGQRPHQG
jgi:hypothetical protein